MAPCFLPDIVAEQVFSVLENMEEREDLTMTLLMMSTAHLRIMGAEEVLSFCRADMVNGAVVTLVRLVDHQEG